MDDSLGPPKGKIYILSSTLMPFIPSPIATVNSMIKDLVDGTKFAPKYLDLIMEISQGKKTKNDSLLIY